MRTAWFVIGICIRHEKGLHVNYGRYSREGKRMYLDSEIDWSINITSDTVR